MRKIVSVQKLFLAFVVCTLLLSCSAAFAATTRTVDEAISWCYAQVGKSIDMDGYPSGQPYQCVDLIKAYYQYLGVSPVSGNGADYAWNALPSGWTRVQGGTPQRGDILVYGASSGNQYGHVAIFEDTRSTFHQNVEATSVKRLTYAYNGFSNPYWGYIRPDFKSSQPNGVAEKLDALSKKFPTGKHWNHVRAQAGDDADTLMDSFNNSYSESITDYGCKGHNVVAGIGEVDCNAFDGAIQCEGFARKIYYEVFGQRISQQYNNKRSDIENIVHGDFIHLRPNHSAIVLSAEGDSLVICEANYDIYGDGTHLCMINWGRRVSRSDVEYFYHASNWNEVQGNTSVKTYYLDVNSTLDGEFSGQLQDYGTCDVYINGTLVSDDVNDYYVALAYGTSYKVTNIKAADGYAYEGNAEFAGTITKETSLTLPFVTCGTLELNGVLDSEPCDDISGLGTCNVYVDGQLVAEGVTDFSGKYPIGERYEITDIVAEDGLYYMGPAAISGTIGSGTNTVELVFSTTFVPNVDWQEASALPAYVNPDTYEIQYKHTYKAKAQTSPGAGWVQGACETTYEDSGEPYYSDFPLTTSDTVVYKGTYYYHFCGATTGNRVNFAWTNAYNVYHEAGEKDMFDVLGKWTDDDDARYIAYQLRWNQGQWAGGNAICAEGRSDIWYIRYRYQNRVAVNTYEWTKTSDWTDTLDSSADSVLYRFRMKDTAAPTIDSVEIAMVCQNGYQVYCKTSDDAGIASVRFGIWKDSEEYSEAKWITYDLAETKTTYEIAETIYLVDFDSERDCFYNTAIIVTDAAGNETQYDGSIRVYVPTVVHSSKKLILPAGLKTVEESAFEGDIGFGEVIVPEGVETIGSKAFADCARLVFVQLPESVTSIAADAFEGNSNVVLFCPAGSEAAKLAQQNGWVYITED